MYIEPAEYLDLTDRITVLTQKYERTSHEKEKLSAQVITLKEKVRMLTSKVTEIQKQKGDNKEHIIQHVTNRAEAIMAHVGAEKQKQTGFIAEQIAKLRNEGALIKLKELQTRIQQNKLQEKEKVFCEKMKTLYIINKKKAKCNYDEIFDWMSDMVNKAQSCGNDSILVDITTSINGTSNKTKSSGKKDKVNYVKNKQNILPQVKEEAEERREQSEQTYKQLKISTKSQKVIRNSHKEPLGILENMI